VINDGTPFTSTLTGAVPTISRDVMIGAYVLAPSSRNPWAIDMPRIWIGKAITATEALAIAHHEITTGLKAF
jgi:hypothetical protein